jgi:sec-independent protein translocase protein TatB
MFDMGFAEMMIIGIVALLVIGPERLPAVASSAGKWFSKIKSFVNNVKSDVEREFKTDELQKMLAKQQDELQSIKEAMNGNNKSSSSPSIKEEIDSISKDLKS